MKKENIMTSNLIRIGVSTITIKQLDFELFLAKDLGIDFILQNGEDSGAILIEFNPAPLIEITKAPPALALWDLRRRALAYRWFRNLTLDSRQNLYEAWYLLKFLCQEIENPLARVLGKSMAELPLDVSSSVIEKYREDILEILLKASATNRIRNSLWKNYTHQVKKSKKTLENIKDPNDPNSLDTLFQELLVLEQEAVKAKIFFGTSPVIYKNIPN